MSANQKIPKGPLAISIFFMSLLLIEIIVVATATPNMPPVYWSIGGFFFIVGLIIYVYLYRKYKAGAYSPTTGSEEVVALDISDKKLFRAHLYIAIFLVIISSVILGLANSPFADPYTRVPQIAAGAILFIAAILNFVIYGTKPEKMKQKYLAKRAKKAVK